MSLSSNILAVVEAIAGTIKNKADKTELPVIMQGADVVTNGTAGLVPAPKIADADKFLKGDGTWSSASASASVSSIEVTGIKKWSTDPVEYFNSIYSSTTVATSENNDTIGLMTIGI